VDFAYWEFALLSIGIFFTLMVAGLSSKLPSAMFSGLTAQGVPAATAASISHLPPIGVVFASFLGNVIAAIASALTGKLVTQDEREGSQASGP
jgi:hypothetical protein